MWARLRRDAEWRVLMPIGASGDVPILRLRSADGQMWAATDGFDFYPVQLKDATHALTMTGLTFQLPFEGSRVDNELLAAFRSPNARYELQRVRGDCAVDLFELFYHPASGPAERYVFRRVDFRS